MKEYSFLLIAMLFSYYTLQAQSIPYRDTLPWAPAGATWVYAASPTITIKYTYDSIVAGQDVKVFKFYAQKYDYSFYPVARPYIEYAGEEYLYNSNDSVFVYDQGLENFVLLYDFNAQEGDVWNINTSYLECLFNVSISRPLTTTIEESTRLVNSSVEYYTIKSNANNEILYSHIIPNIGNTDWFFPLYNRDSCTNTKAKYLNYDASNLACYTDPIRGRLMPGGVNFDSTCTATINMVEDFIVGVEKPTLADNKNDKFSIYPNPAQSHLNVFSNGVFIKEIVIYDAVGRLVIQDKSQGESINISGLNSGLYVINILDEKNEISAFKFVKE